MVISDFGSSVYTQNLIHVIHVLLAGLPNILIAEHLSARSVVKSQL